MSGADPTSLTVGGTVGLANRLRVLLSGKALAELTGREFTMLWPRTPACGASFGELFENKWNVVEVSAQAAAALPLYGGYRGRSLPDLAARAALPPFAAVDWLVPRDASWRTRLARNGSLVQVTGLHAAVMRRAEELLSELRPLGELAARVRALHTGFRPAMIGVHLRRGDFNEHRSDVTNNTAIVLDQVDRWLRAVPEAGILLCTDDGATDYRTGTPTAREGVRAVFARRYGSRLLTSEPRSLDRQSVVGVQDALVDLWLLRRVDLFVGTRRSSYTELATFGRTIPRRELGMGRRRHRWMRYTGVEAGIIGVGWMVFRRPLPAPIVLRQLRESLSGSQRRH